MSPSSVKALGSGLVRVSSCHRGPVSSPICLSCGNREVEVKGSRKIEGTGAHVEVPEEVMAIDAVVVNETQRAKC